MHTTEWQKSMWKYYILYDPQILKSQNYEGNQDISGYQELVVREEEGTLRTVKLFFMKI